MSIREIVAVVAGQIESCTVFNQVKTFGKKNQVSGNFFVQDYSSKEL